MSTANANSFACSALPVALTTSYFPSHEPAWTARRMEDEPVLLQKDVSQSLIRKLEAA